MSKFVEPSIHRTDFNCPLCGVFTQQHWKDVWIKATPKTSDKPAIMTFTQLSRELAVLERKRESHTPANGPFRHAKLLEALPEMLTASQGSRPIIGPESSETVRPVNGVWLSKCYHCKMHSVWVGERLVDPPFSNTIAMNPDIPAEAQNDFQEAANCLTISPRASTALLRLCLERICRHLGYTGKLDKMIGQISAQHHLNTMLHEALDIVRVTGNNAIHPGEMNKDDDQETATLLFSVINTIVQQLISTPKMIKEMYESKIPEALRQRIKERNEKYRNNIEGDAQSEEG